MYEATFCIIVLIILFVYLNITCDGVVWKYIDKLMSALDCYYRDALDVKQSCFPKSSVTMYHTGCSPQPCQPSCGCSSGGCHKKSSCEPKLSITSACNKDKEVVYGCYKYILDKLPGIIVKYKVDNCCNIIPDSRTNVYHSLGVLVRIYINAGNIVVEDSFSIEHVATVDVATGNLTF